MIKNIILDIGMVLVNFAWKETMIELGFDDKCIETLDKNLINNSLWDELDLGILPEKEVIDKAIALSPQYKREITEFWDKNLLTIRPYEYSKNWVCDMKAKGLKVFLLTNYPDTLFEKSVRYAFPFYPYIDGEIVSSRVKLRKPDAGIYTCLMDKYDLKPEECIFFDDRVINVEAAVSLGINAFVFENYDKAVMTINSLVNI